MRLLPLLLTLAACVPDIGDDDETDGTSEQLPDEQECVATHTEGECSEATPCEMVDNVWVTCNWSDASEYPDCPCAGLEYGYSGEVD